MPGGRERGSACLCLRRHQGETALVAGLFTNPPAILINSWYLMINVCYGSFPLRYARGGISRQC